jgi:hypothetical protein
VRAQAAEAAERERYEQKLRVAQLMQQQFLPHQLPRLGEWQVAAYYRPARVVGGDFYEFIQLATGIGIVVGDVTDRFSRPLRLVGLRRGPGRARRPSRIQRVSGEALSQP